MILANSLAKYQENLEGKTMLSHEYYKPRTQCCVFNIFFQIDNFRSVYLNRAGNEPKNTFVFHNYVPFNLPCSKLEKKRNNGDILGITLSSKLFKNTKTH